MIGIKKILVPIDLSSVSAPAIRYASSLAKQLTPTSVGSPTQKA